VDLIERVIQSIKNRISEYKEGLLSYEDVLSCFNYLIKRNLDNSLNTTTKPDKDPPPPYTYKDPLSTNPDTIPQPIITIVPSKFNDLGYKIRVINEILRIDWSEDPFFEISDRDPLLVCVLDGNKKYPNTPIEENV